MTTIIVAIEREGVTTTATATVTTTTTTTGESTCTTESLDLDDEIGILISIGTDTLPLDFLRMKEILRSTAGLPESGNTVSKTGRY